MYTIIKIEDENYPYVILDSNGKDIDGYLFREDAEARVKRMNSPKPKPKKRLYVSDYAGSCGCEDRPCCGCGQ